MLAGIDPAVALIVTASVGISLDHVAPSWLDQWMPR
jgi:hypothetical protein